MKVLITYDISLDINGAKRLRHIAQACLNYGMRVQYSVFECEVSPDQWVILKDNLLSMYNPKVDSLRFYMLGSKWQSKVEHYGAKVVPDIFRDPLII